MAGRRHPVLKLDQFPLQAKQFPEIALPANTLVLRLGMAMRRLDTIKAGIIEFKFKLLVEAIQQFLFHTAVNLCKVGLVHGVGKILKMASRVLAHC